MEACHNDGNRLNNQLKNLRWDTSSNNHKDAFKHGARNHQGERHARAKLHSLQVRTIKRLLQFEMLRQKEIAEVFGVTRITISNIKTGKRWGHLKLRVCTV